MRKRVLVILLGLFILVGCSARVNLPSGFSGFRVVEGERKHAEVEVNTPLTREELLNWNVREIIEDNELLYLLAIIDDKYALRFFRSGLHFVELSETRDVSTDRRAFYCSYNYEEQLLDCYDFSVIIPLELETYSLENIDEYGSYENYFKTYFFRSETSERFFKALTE